MCDFVDGAVCFCVCVCVCVDLHAVSLCQCAGFSEKKVALYGCYSAVFLSSKLFSQLLSVFKYSGYWGVEKVDSFASMDLIFRCTKTGLKR